MNSEFRFAGISVFATWPPLGSVPHRGNTSTGPRVPTTGVRVDNRASDRPIINTVGGTATPIEDIRVAVDWVPSTGWQVLRFFAAPKRKRFLNQDSVELVLPWLVERAHHQAALAAGPDVPLYFVLHISIINRPWHVRNQRRDLSPRQQMQGLLRREDTDVPGNQPDPSALNSQLFRTLFTIWQKTRDTLEDTISTRSVRPAESAEPLNTLVFEHYSPARQQSGYLVLGSV